MLKPEMVPDAAWRAAMSTYHKKLRKYPAMAWQEAVAAALAAWPDIETEAWIDGNGFDVTILVPFPQETESD